MKNIQELENELEEMKLKIIEEKKEIESKEKEKKRILGVLKKSPLIKLDSLEKGILKENELSKEEEGLFDQIYSLIKLFGFSSQVVGSLGSVSRSNGKVRGRMGAHVQRLKEDPSLISEIKRRRSEEGIGRHSLGLELGFGVSGYNIVEKVESGYYDHLLD